MGQKTNPNIFRLGKTNNWESKYLEKKSTELPFYIFKDLEIKNFIGKYFNDNGLTIHYCKLYHLDGSLHIFLSYYNQINSISLIDNINKIQKIKLSKKSKNFNKNYIKFNINKYKSYKDIIYTKNFKNPQISLKNIKKISNKNKKIFKIRRIQNLELFKKYKLTKNYNNFNNITANSFLEKFFESLTQFTKRKLNIILTLQKLNKNIKKTIIKENYKKIKKNLVQLRKYNQNKFFKEGVNLLFLITLNKETSKIISNFISKQLKTIKRHNFFLKFIKTVLTLFINTNSSNIKGIKIKIKGRLNGAPRAKHKIIKIGNNIPILTINKNINYFESTSFTSNGTLGVKVWVCEN